MSNFVPSKYQAAIFDWFNSGSGNIMVEAVAGSGKTSTLVEGLQRLPPTVARDAFFAAFNSAIVEELKRKLNGAVETKTIHALGFQSLRNAFKEIKNWNVDDSKYRAMARRVKTDHGDQQVIRDAILSLLRFTQLSLATPTPDDLFRVAIKFNIDLPLPIEQLAGVVSEMLEEGLSEARKGRISFGDMLYAPVALNLPIRKYSLVAVDECQDLSKVQMELVRRALAPGGRFIGVGDSRQAIYFFAGAESDSFFQLRDYFDAQTLPLSICYRCPRSVVEMARSIVSQIEAADTATEGKVGHLTAGQFKQELKPGDMVLCRLTAPLVKLCFELLAQRINAKVKGKDIGASLTNAVKTIAKQDYYSWDKFPASLYQWRDNQIRALEQKPGTESAIEAVTDKAECLMICYTTFQSSTVERFCADIEGLFTENGSPITLSTVHRSKGLENERIFVIRPDKLPLAWKGQTAQEAEQEMNLKYVAITRARQELYFVDHDGGKE